MLLSFRLCRNGTNNPVVRLSPDLESPLPACPAEAGRIIFLDVTCQILRFVSCEFIQVPSRLQFARFSSNYEGFVPSGQCVSLDLVCSCSKGQSLRDTQVSPASRLFL